MVAARYLFEVLALGADTAATPDCLMQLGDAAGTLGGRSQGCPVMYLGAARVVQCCYPNPNPSPRLLLTLALALALALALTLTLTLARGFDSRKPLFSKQIVHVQP